MYETAVDSCSFLSHHQPASPRFPPLAGNFKLNSENQAGTGGNLVFKTTRKKQDVSTDAALHHRLRITGGDAEQCWCLTDPFVQHRYRDSFEHLCETTRIRGGHEDGVKITQESRNCCRYTSSPVWWSLWIRLVCFASTIAFVYGVPFEEESTNRARAMSSPQPMKWTRHKS
jgi:hypothetical protein